MLWHKLHFKRFQLYFAQDIFNFEIFHNLILPISEPVFATVAILTFFGSWNLFLWPIMTIRSDELRPDIGRASVFLSTRHTSRQVMAYSTLVVIPVLIFFFLF
jgi:multiple sugar transport system permease protein